MLRMTNYKHVFICFVEQFLKKTANLFLYIFLIEVQVVSMNILCCDHDHPCAEYCIATATNVWIYNPL